MQLPVASPCRHKLSVAQTENQSLWNTIILHVSRQRFKNGAVSFKEKDLLKGQKAQMFSPNIF